MVSLRKTSHADQGCEQNCAKANPQENISPTLLVGLHPRLSLHVILPQVWLDWHGKRQGSGSANAAPDSYATRCEIGCHVFK